MTMTASRWGVAKAWLRAALALALAWAAPAFAQAGAQAHGEWAGPYSCSSKPGLFTRPAPVFQGLVRLTLKDGGLTGIREEAGYMEKFHGSVNPLGEVTLIADGFAAGANGQTSTLTAAGRAGSVDMILTGERVEMRGTRTERELDCVLMLTRAAEPADAARERERTPEAIEPPRAPAAVARAEPAPTVAAPEAPAAAPPVRVQRLALVIGNNNYRHVSRLVNATADAGAIADALERTGFQVSRGMDLDERGFKQTLRNFRAEIRPGDEVVLFYAGHGVQLGGANYLLPVDIRSENEDQVRDESMPLQRMLDDFADRRAGFMLAIIDACRDNPFRGVTRSLAGRGLAPTTAATGQMIIYSAGSGQQALDRLGPNDPHPNGVFTRVFVREMEVPDITVDRVLRNVRNEVVRLARSVGHEQTPALYDQAVGDFYLRRRP
jgi:hypothetical protein